MTVGIGAICHRHSEPHVLVTADRMVTYGQQGGVEYEDTSSKIATIVESDELTAVAVGAGVSTYIDEILQKTQNAIRSPQNQSPTTIEEAMNFVLTMYQNTVRETINNSIMEPLGYRLEDLKNPDVDIPSEHQRVIAKESYEIRNEVGNKVRILVAGVGQSGPGVYLISGTDYTNFSDMGYGIIGSGSDSARLTFIRRRYDQYTDYPEALFTVIDAKSQAEERQGVGQKMDLVSIGQDSIYRYDEGDKEEIRQKLTKIEAEERVARESVIDEWEPKI